MNNKIKKIFILFLLASLIVPSIFSQSISLSIIDGDKDSFNMYNEVGEKIELDSTDNIVVDSKVIIKTKDKEVQFSYEYGTFNLKDNSILVANPFDTKPVLYLVDGQIDLNTNPNFILDYVITTPVSKYQFSSPAKVSIISTEMLEYGVFFEGQGTSYNSISGETTLISSLEMIDMSFPNNFTLDVPKGYSSNTDVNNPELLEAIEQTYKAKDEQIFAAKKQESQQKRANFLTSPYLFDIKPIQKSNELDKYTTINLVITGNGQGNISALDLPTFSGIIKQAKSNNENILLIDGGNTINGSSFVNFDKGKTASRVLDMVGYDVFVPGAMDLSYGPEHLARLNKSVETDFISTNALNEDLLLYFDPYGLYLFDDFKIVVLGLSNPSDITKQMNLDLTNNIIIDNAQEAINQANEIADYVIVVSNLNYEQFDSSFILNNVKGIDLLIDSNNSNANLMNVNGVPLINTGVGYSEIHNYTIRVQGNELLSTRHASIYSSTLGEDKNKLTSSLNVDSFTKDYNLLNFLNTIQIPEDISLFLKEPAFAEITVVKDGKQLIYPPKEVEVEPVLIQEVPKAPATVEVKTKQVPLAPSIIDVQSEEIVKTEVPAAPSTVKVKIQPEAPSIIKVKTQPEAPSIIKFKIDSSIVEEDAVADPVIVKEPLIQLEAPSFKEQSFSVRKTRVLEQPVEKVEEEVIEEQLTEEEEVIEEQVSEEVVTTTETKKATIFSDEDAKIKTHIGLDTTLAADVNILDTTFKNIDYLANLTLSPYIYRGGYSLGLRFKGNTDFSSFETNIIPLPTTLSETSAYILDFIDHVKIVNPSDSIIINANRNTFNTLTTSSLTYDTLGGDALHLTGVFDFEKIQVKGFLSDLDIIKPFINTPEKLNAALTVVFKPVDLLDISVGTLAIGHKNELDFYPTLNLNLIPVNNKDIQLNLNLGVTLYLKAIPDLDFTTILDTSDTKLIPNYLANTSIDISTERFNFFLGANYLITEDKTKFTTNMIHKNVVNNSNNIFPSAKNNTLTAIGKFSYKHKVLDLSAKYSIPIDLSPSLAFTQRVENDLVDIDLGIKLNNFTLGGFYLHNDFGNNVVTLAKNITDLSAIKSFLINNNTEYGGYVTYNFKDLAVKGAVYLPSPSAPLAFKVSLNYKLDFAF